MMSPCLLLKPVYVSISSCRRVGIRQTRMQTRSWKSSQADTKRDCREHTELAHTNTRLESQSMPCVKDIAVGIVSRQYTPSLLARSQACRHKKCTNIHLSNAAPQEQVVVSLQIQKSHEGLAIQMRLLGLSLKPSRTISQEGFGRRLGKRSSQERRFFGTSFKEESR